MKKQTVDILVCGSIPCLMFLIFLAALNSSIYAPTGNTRIEQTTKKNGMISYVAQYEKQNWIGRSSWISIDFTSVLDKECIPAPLLPDSEIFEIPPTQGTIECAKKRIDKYLADIENQEGWKVVKTEYIKYP